LASPYTSLFAGGESNIEPLAFDDDERKREEDTSKSRLSPDGMDGAKEMFNDVNASVMMFLLYELQD